MSELRSSVSSPPDRSTSSPFDDGKQIIAQRFNDGVENFHIYLSAAATVGIVTGTATNPIWVVKIRLQLTANNAKNVLLTSEKWLVSGLDMAKKIPREEKIRGLY